MDELEKLAKEAWRPPEADTQRLKVDLKIVPHTLYSDPHFFVANTRSCGGKFYRDLFNTLYREERFCEEDFRIYMVTPTGYEERTLAQLLPDSFSL